MPEEAETEAGTGRPGGAAALTALEEAVHGADLEHALHVLVQDAHLGLPVGVDDELCDETTGAVSEQPGTSRLWSGPLRRRADGAGLTFLRGRVLHGQCDELLVGGQDGPL